MIRIGKFNDLTILRMSPHGAYLGEEENEDSVLLPNSQLNDDSKIGDTVRVFIYKDSQDRIIATKKTPYAIAGELAYLKVSQITKIGAFLDWGLEKDLLLPLKEQKYKIQEGHSYLVYIYVDKSNRLCATTSISDYLLDDSNYEKNDFVNGTVYRVNPEIGAFIAVDDKYFGLIPQNELFKKMYPGDKIEARVIRVREDGKLDLSPRMLAHEQMDKDAELILKLLEANDGYLNLHDKSDPEEIKRRLQLSKNAFKKAIGRLFKEQKISIEENGIKLK